MIRWTFGSEVRVWSLEDGKLLQTFKRQPQSNVRLMRLAPDGKTFYTYDQLPGTYERGPKQTVSLWDVKAGTCWTVEGLDPYGIFSPDGKAMAFPSIDADGYNHGLKLIDVATGREKWSIPIKDRNSRVWTDLFSRDGRLLLGEVSVFERANQWDKSRSRLKWWDAATGGEVGSFECAPNEVSTFTVLSPDGQIAVARTFNRQEPKIKLSLFHVSEKRLLRTIVIGEKTKGLRAVASSATFSPDGKWIAVVTGMYPEKNDVEDPRDIPQPRILLIETATGAIHETLIAPQSFTSANAPCFSPDGRTLATCGHGRVLLWDMTKTPH